MQATLTHRRMRSFLAIFATIAMLTALAPGLTGRAADHLDAPGLMSPNGNSQADINDLYAFPGSATSSVFALTVVPAASANSSFGTDLLYAIHVDVNGNAVEDHSFEFTFSDVRPNGAQYLMVQHHNVAANTRSLIGFGQVGKELTLNNGGKLFTGLRSDPFFFDLAGFLGTVEGANNGRMLNDANKNDFFADLDVLAIVLEVPDTMVQLAQGSFGGGLYGQTAIGVWAATSKGGAQIDRIGRPAINTALNSSGPIVNAPSENKNVFNRSHPRNDAANFTSAAAAALVAYSSLDTEGAYTSCQLGVLATIFLPDILPYSKTTTLPSPIVNRALADDVIDVSLRVVTGGDPLGLFGPSGSFCTDGPARNADGAINTDGVGAHNDYLSTFPYLGAPHASMPALPQARTNFWAKLSGSAEVPAVSTAARGVATLSASANALDHLIVAYGLTGATAAHIHLGDAHENGPVVVGLFSGEPFTADGMISSGTTVSSGLVAGTMRDLLDVMSGGFAYVNVHTTANPGGEIRGQITALATAATGSRFTDDNGNPHERAIEILAAAGITKGTSATTYAPFRSITRGEMAAFLNRALNLPPSNVNAFTDDNDSIFEADINALAAAGITTGTTSTTFEPNRTITRGEMAAMLVRGFDLPPSSVDAFTDDNDSPFEADINALAAAGVTKGTSATTYHPSRDVTRAEMASFIARWLGWID